MVRRVVIFATMLLVVAFTAIGVLGYQFCTTGDDYGHVAQQPNDATLRRISQGAVVGFLDETDTHTWLGIPYAAPPLDDLRWTAPQEPDDWNSTLSATQASDYCKQIASFGESRPPKDIGMPIGSEDCLYLNVFAPKYAPGTVPTGENSRPVMVYIHGGGNTAGYANQYKYSGRHLAQHHDVIVVTFNYRLGPFGWFSHPALNIAGSAEDRSGNYGVLDALKVLRWVRTNISAFGGDPDNVTLFGESAGGMNVFALLASPLSDGLFHKAIIQSGLPISMPSSVGRNYVDDINPGHKYSGREVTNKLLIADGSASDRTDAMRIQSTMSDTQLASYLRGQNADHILAQYDGGNIMAVPMLFEDGTVMPNDDLMETLAKGRTSQDVPLIVGTNRDEFKMIFLGEKDLVEFKYGFLPRLKNPAYFEAVTGYFNDGWKAHGVDEIAVSLSKTNDSKIFAYRFDWDQLPTILGTDLSMLMGAAHASEIPFVFRSLDDGLMNKLMFNAETLKSRDTLSTQMSSYWAEFAYSGIPGRGRNGDLTPWRPWQNAQNVDKSMIFASEGDNHMMTEEITLATLKQRLMADERFPDQISRGQIYDCLFRDTVHWNTSEFEALGGSSCTFPIFGFLKL